VNFLVDEGKERTKAAYGLNEYLAQYGQEGIGGINYVCASRAFLLFRFPCDQNERHSRLTAGRHLDMLPALSC
jgi:hypothetical protein